ncbi:TetR/AcrR family transcriptional regulator [Glycomyces sp. NPDC021274]|uniref:TetR/AcrR family transcriptional regulator n=1 Tax=Glycomyces sp. NPDC021274 TaxID=3155120 RepID=UPI0033DAB245
MKDSARNRRSRADAARNREAVLDAATRLLDRDPGISMEALASTAGVTRQTVYAHFASREELLAAALDRITDEAVAAMDAADLDRGPAAAALVRLIEAGDEVAQRYPGLVGLAAPLADTETDLARHSPVVDRIMQVIRRGQATGEFDPQAPPEWLAAAVIALGHAAGREAATGRLTSTQSQEALRVSLMRILDVKSQSPED